MNSLKANKSENKYFRTFLLKVTARCNIDCTYCYEYNSADQSWRHKPSRMSFDIFNQSIERIYQHIIKHEVSSVHFIIHGGEPLLAGKDFIRYILKSIRHRLEPFCKVGIGIQSNGILIDDEWIALLHDLDCTIGVSIDGFKELNDKFRVDHKGESTYERVIKGLSLLRSNSNDKIFSGLLCVMQPDSNPIESIRWFQKWAPTKIDFLFPHYNYSNKPPYLFDVTHGYGFGLWLSKIFDYWWDNDISDLQIRVFEDLIHLMLGGYFSVEAYGLSPVRIALIQTDGEYEALDSLKATYNGAVVTHKNVFAQELDELLTEDLIATRLDRFDALADVCKNCRLVSTCGGGYVPHRYHPKYHFKAPSIYCTDLTYLIEHIEARLLSLGDNEISSKLKANLASNVDLTLYG